MNIELYLSQCQHRVNKALHHFLPSANKNPAVLHQAMRYAALNGGKRIRAALVYATGEAFDAHPKTLDCISAAIEMIHAYTLIHDDLPAIDNDDLRRGKPSCHKAFSEATAILAGDSLQTLAFQILSESQEHVSTAVQLQMIRYLACAIGSTGVIGGEVLDIAMENKSVSLRELAICYKLKTSNLLSASIVLGALAANHEHNKKLLGLEKFGHSLGLAFQIHDDIIGVESDTQLLGKPQGSDALRNKPTYPSLLGMKRAKKTQALAFKRAIFHLNQARIPSEKLIAISNYIIERNK